METLRGALPWLVSAVLAAALVAPAAIGQSDESPVAPSLDEIIAQLDPAAVRKINADKVDGRHAVGATTDKKKRAGKLVATNSKGFLPSNIVKPKWPLIKGKPAGFADGVDNAGVTRITVTRVTGPIVTVLPGAYGDATVDCPTGAVVTGGGPRPSNAVFRSSRSTPNPGLSGWYVLGQNEGTSSLQLNAWAVCMSVQPSGNLAARG